MKMGAGDFPRNPMYFLKLVNWIWTGSPDAFKIFSLGFEGEKEDIFHPPTSGHSPRCPVKGGKASSQPHFSETTQLYRVKAKAQFFSGLCMYFQVGVYFAWSALTLWFLLVFSPIVAGELWPLTGFMVELPLSEKVQGRFSNTGVPGQKQGQNFFAFPSHSIHFISCFLSSGLFFSSSCPASCGCFLPPVLCRGMELPSLCLCQDAMYVPLLTNFLHICTYYQKTWRAIDHLLPLVIQRVCIPEMALGLVFVHLCIMQRASLQMI